MSILVMLLGLVQLRQITSRVMGQICILIVPHGTYLGSNSEKIKLTLVNCYKNWQSKINDSRCLWFQMKGNSGILNSVKSDTSLEKMILSFSSASSALGCSGLAVVEPTPRFWWHHIALYFAECVLALASAHLFL